MFFTEEGTKSKSIKMSNLERTKEWCNNISKSKNWSYPYYRNKKENVYCKER